MRMKQSCSGLKFNLNDHLQEAIKKQVKQDTKHKAKIIYTQNGDLIDIEILPYWQRQIKKIKLINSSIIYDKKWLDRTQIDLLYQKRDDCDEILIIKDGYLSDTSIANVALLKNGRWLTPKKPLLHGTTRQRLLDEKSLKTADLTTQDLLKASAFAVLNAMVGFRIINNPKFELA